MEGPRLQITERLRALMSYRKFSGPVPRVLFLESNYWLDRACIAAAQRMGWDVRCTPVSMIGVMPRDQWRDLFHAVAEFRPDFVLSINLSAMDEQGILAGLLEDLHLPHATWFVDDPRTILMDRTCYGGPYAVALAWDAAYVDSLRRGGFADVHVLPLAADISLFDATPAEECDRSPTFVGNSMIDFAQKEWKWFEDKPALAALVRGAFDAGRVTRENFGIGLDALLGEKAVADMDAEARRHAELYIFIEGTRRLRHTLAEMLVPEGMALRGDADWRKTFPDAGPCLDYRNELPSHYRGCSVNVNTTSIQMPNTVNQRVFDCPAAGGFLLTDAQPALEELFDVTTEIAAYRTEDEARDLLRFFLKRPAARRAVASQARRRILAEHTYAHRLIKLAALLRVRFG